MKGTRQSWENTQHCAVGIYQEIGGNVNCVGDQLEIVVSSILCHSFIIKEFLGENRWCLPLCHPLLWPNSLHSVPNEKQFLHPHLSAIPGAHHKAAGICLGCDTNVVIAQMPGWLLVWDVPRWGGGGTKVGPPRWLCAAQRSATLWLGSGQVTALCQHWFLSRQLLLRSNNRAVKPIPSMR